MDSFTCPNSSSEHRRCSRLEPSVPTGDLRTASPFKVERPNGRSDRRSPTELVVGGVNAPLPIWARLLALSGSFTCQRH